MLTNRMSSINVLGCLFLALGILSCDGSQKGEGGSQPARVVVPAGEVHEGWFFGAGDEVIIEGTINGDAYVAGGHVQVDGVVNGDLIAAGGSIRISGKVSDDVRATGGNIECNGTVGKNFTAAGGNVRIAKEAVVEGGLLAAGGNVSIAGTVRQEAILGAGNVGISGTVDRNVQFAGGTLAVTKGAVVGGSLKALVEKAENVDIAAGSVKGTVEVNAQESKPERAILGWGVGHFWLKIVWALSLIATAFVCVLLLPRQFAGIGTTILQQPGKSILWGILAVIVLPIVMLILFLTLVGIPIGLFLLMLYLWVAYLSQLSLGVALGQRILGGEGKWKLFLSSAAGIAIVQVLMFIPYVKVLVALAGLLFGFGAILLVLKSTFDSVRDGSQKPEGAIASPTQL